MRTLLVIILTVIAVYAFLIWYGEDNDSNTHNARVSGHPADVVTSHSQNANQVVKPYDLARNPYMLNGQQAVLTTRGIPMVDRLGRFQVEFPFNSLRYSNMIDENTAIYDVLIGEDTISDFGGQIAVHLATDSPKPELGRPWRVVIQRPMRVVNGLGVERNIATVSFQGYGTLPAPPQPKTPQPQTPRPTDAEQPEVQTAPPPHSDGDQPSEIQEEH
ncbi:hypothetical protein [Terriglobus sp. TAA 43]|uniref:hypothetical protein n=1 Tax=Terriglobus sp. TAA 43 TaxID=278961 RepID=UPI00064887BC|nr:hypothetical protein [Terriglobus sp. TAA 43]